MKAAMLSIPVFLFLALFAFTTVLAEKGKDDKKPKEGTAVGDLAPDFTLKDMADKDVKLSSFKGTSAVMLVFWFADCPSCKKEIPDINKLYTDYKDKGLTVLALNVADKKTKIEKFIKDQGIKYPVLLDTSQEVTRKYKVVGVPTNILIDTEGVIKFREYTPPKDKDVKAILPKPKEEPKDKPKEEPKEDPKEEPKEEPKK